MLWLKKLKAMKEHSGLTTREIALHSKIPEPTLEKLFAGHTKDPKLNTISQLVHFLGYTLDDLVDEDDFQKESNSQMAIKKEPPSISTETENDSNLQKLLSNYDSMNLMGQFALADYSDYLCAKEEYRKHSNIPTVEKQA